MRTRYGASPWVHTFPSTRRPEFPRIRGEHTADVAIVGGGLTGCATAYACAAAGLKVLVLERDRVGQGSAGRSAGLLLSDPRPAFRDIAQAHGVRAARLVFQSWRRAAIDGAALLRRLGVPGVEAHDSLVVAYRDEEKALRRELTAREEAGLEARWLVQKQIRQATGMEAFAGMRLREGHSVNPYRACLALATAARKRGVALFERSHVRKVRFGRRDVEVVLDGASIRAATAIVTTGMATPEFQPLRRHFKRRETYLVLTEPMPGAMRRAVGPRKAVIRDWRSPRHRIRFTTDGRILVAGADQDETPEKKRQPVLVQRTGQLMYELLTMYPVISGLAPEFGWDLSYGETADGLMYIGPHRNYPHHLFALGGDADSLADAFLAARVLARAAAGEPEKGDEVFGWTR